jgi:hypothetical protein
MAVGLVQSKHHLIIIIQLKISHLALNNNNALTHVKQAEVKNVVASVLKTVSKRNLSLIKM